MRGVGIHIICVGKLKEKFYADAVAEYTKRLNSYCRLRITELPEERLPAEPSRAQIEAALEKEAQAVRVKLPKGGVVIALCIEGELLSSEKLAAKLERWSAEGKSDFVFLIGSSYGMNTSLKEQAHLRLSMSPMTFPHHLARVMLLEQVYRCFKIGEGSGYHK